MPHGRTGEYTPVMSRRSVLVVDGWRLELERKKTRESRVRRVRSGWCARYHTRAAPRTHGDDATRSYELQRGTRRDAVGPQAPPEKKKVRQNPHCVARRVGGLRTFFWSTLHISASPPRPQLRGSSI